MPKVSIIIPVYNAESHLKNLFNYINEQTYKDYEVIFINDGSIDNSLVLIENYCTHYDNAILINKENGGVSSARNLGMKKAKGEYFVFWDADDKIGKDFLTEMVNNLERNALTLCGCYDEGLYEQALIKIYSEKEDVSVISKNNVVALQSVWLFNTLWNKIFDRKIIDELKLTFNENSSYGEDAEFIARYIKAVDNYKIINKPLYTYIRTPENATGRFHRTIYQTNKRIYENIIDSMDKSISDYEECLKSVRLAYATTAIGALWHYCKHSRCKTNQEIKESLKDLSQNKNLLKPKLNLLLKIVLKVKWVWLAKLYYKTILRGKK